jgi:glutathione S-transferase
MSMKPHSATIIGGPVSPYVRKVLAVCEMKGVPYRLDPIVPFFGDDTFSEVSPLRRIPVFIDDRVSLCDSTVISEYLEDRYPGPPVLPAAPELRARVRWLEEFADTRMCDVFIWRIFYEAVVLPFIFQKPRNKEKIAAAVAEQLPDVMAYLEKVAPGEGFLCGEVSMADIAVAVPFSNLGWARVEVDKRRWPKTCAWVERTHATQAVAKVTRFGDTLMKTPPDGHRTALAELGVPLTDASVATDKPRRGPMSVQCRL